MKTINVFWLTVFIMLTGCTCATLNESNKIASDSELERIGLMIESIDYALTHPELEDSLETITLAGTDSRHYTMIRGWLVQVLSGVESQASATQDEDRAKALQLKIDFLRKAIRRIDLE